MAEALPVSVQPRAGQSIESWLEHLADANGLTTASLLRLVRDDTGSGRSRFLTLTPSPSMLARLAEVARVDARCVYAASMAGFDGLAVDLTGLDHDDHHSYRQVAARGWTPAHGTQICPPCLADTGAWLTAWRLPLVTACVRHESFLIAACPGCRRPFRDQHHSHLRRVGAATVCGNPLGQGPTRQCEHDLTIITTHPTDVPVLATQRRIDGALQRRDVVVLGQPATSAAYLTDLRHLTTLLLHLAAQPHAAALADWATDLKSEAAPRSRTGTRGPRWGLRPPDDPALRGRALATADAILSAADHDAAAQALTPWVDLTPRTIEGALGWLADRTVMTSTLTRLVMAARAPHRRLSHHLDTLDPDQQNGATMRLDIRGIPQVIPEPLYREHLAGAFDSGEGTVRVFASLCLARMNPDVTSWAAAAHALGLPIDVGVLTARTCSASARIDNTDWTDRLYRVRTDLPRRDYRQLEVRLWGLNNQTGWFDQWRNDCRPATRDDTITDALVWLWVHVGHGHLDTAAGWNGQPPTTRRRAAYRQFEATLGTEQRARLGQTMDVPASGTAARSPDATDHKIGDT